MVQATAVESVTKGGDCCVMAVERRHGALEQIIERIE
jgi:hypothetical protein